MGLAPWVAVILTMMDSAPEGYVVHSIALVLDLEKENLKLHWGGPIRSLDRAFLLPEDSQSGSSIISDLDCHFPANPT